MRKFLSVDGEADEAGENQGRRQNSNDQFSSASALPTLLARKQHFTQYVKWHKNSFVWVAGLKHRLSVFAGVIPTSRTNGIISLIFYNKFSPPLLNKFLILNTKIKTRTDEMIRFAVKNISPPLKPGILFQTAKALACRYMAGIFRSATADEIQIDHRQLNV